MPDQPENKEVFLDNQLVKTPVAVQQDIRELRIAAGLTQERAAERFDVSLRTWQAKEAGKPPAKLSQGEYELLMLLAGKHPYFSLVSRGKKQA